MARILIIDDDPVVSLTLARMLELDGYEVSRAGTAQDGLSAAAAETPDCSSMIPAMSVTVSIFTRQCP